MTANSADTREVLIADLPHGGKQFDPWPHEPPEGWPYSYVAKADFDALLSRCEKAERERDELQARLTSSQLQSKEAWQRLEEYRKDAERLRAALDDVLGLHLAITVMGNEPPDAADRLQHATEILMGADTAREAP
jgi:hypothetical protein